MRRKSEDQEGLPIHPRALPMLEGTWFGLVSVAGKDSASQCKCPRILLLESWTNLTGFGQPYMTRPNFFKMFLVLLMTSLLLLSNPQLSITCDISLNHGDITHLP